ncbi:TRAP transporter small permease [Sporosarcina sp.]|uniref:TRAP transporter small permease n=1 Tax=Sporosarcina sp. TaxID=49982 RepID=UPI00261FDBFE|nr:TRAP transporter small permease [Sporosarcina sp.]
MKKFLRFIEKFEEIFLVTTMVAILLMIFSQALFRYFFGSGIVWGEEFARYIHVAQVWIGSSLAIKMGGHIRVTFVRDLMNDTCKKVLDLLATFLFFVFMAFITYKGTLFILQLLETGQKAPSSGILMAIPYSVIPLGAFFMVLRLIQQFRGILKGELLEEEIEGVEQ